MLACVHLLVGTNRYTVLGESG